VGPRVCLDGVAKTKIPIPCRELNPSRVARSLVTILTELSGLSLRLQYIRLWQVFSYVCPQSRIRTTLQKFNFVIFRQRNFRNF
jgi:hypothetical protein